MGDLASLLVGAGVVEGVGELVLDGRGDLYAVSKVSDGGPWEMWERVGFERTASCALAGTWEPPVAWDTPCPDSLADMFLVVGFGD